MTSGWQARPPRSREDRGNPYDAAWRKVREGVLVRDGYVCRICGVDLMTLAPKLRTVDHIVALAVRPDLRLDPTNLRAACMRCNRRLGAQLANARSNGSNGRRASAATPPATPQHDWTHGCPDTHKGQSCYTVGRPMRPHSRDW